MTEGGSDELRYGSGYRVRFDEAGPDGLLRISGLLRYAQDVAWQHADARGLDRAWHSARDLAWVVRAAEIEVLEPVGTGAELDVTTAVLGYQRIWARRRAECRTADGRLAAWIQTDWVMIDGGGRLTRVPAAIPERFPGRLLSEPLLRVTLPEPPEDALVSRFRVRPHELDPMNHVNNAVYVDWLEDTVSAAGSGAGRVVARRPLHLRLEYAAAAGPDTEIEARAWAQDSGWACRLSTPRGGDLFRATIAARPGSEAMPVSAGRAAGSGR